MRAGTSTSGSEAPALWVGGFVQDALRAAESHLGPGRTRSAARLAHVLSLYAVYDPETGYCQGMSDLALPFVTLFQVRRIAGQFRIPCMRPSPV